MMFPLGIAAKLYASAGLALALLLGSLWVVHTLHQQGAAQCKSDVAAAAVKFQAEAAAQEGAWNESARELSKARTAADASTDARYAADLARLRARAASAASLPQAAASAGSANGLVVDGLPERDRDLLGTGAAANQLRNFAAQCAAWIAEVKSGEK